MSRFLLMAILFLIPLEDSFAAVAVAVPEPPKHANGSPTLTLVYEAENPRLTLVLLLGGEGRLRINLESTGTRQATVQMAQALTRKDFSPVGVNLVVFSSPVELFPPGVRSNAEHLDRVESVVRFAQDRFKLPVWLLGHSYGTISATEYLMQKEAAIPVAGVILSGGVYQLRFKPRMNLPILFLHHEHDGCKGTPLSFARRNFETVKASNAGTTELLLVSGGTEQGDPCRDGKHMYRGAYAEAAQHVADFLVRTVK